MTAQNEQIQCIMKHPENIVDLIMALETLKHLTMNLK